VWLCRSMPLLLPRFSDRPGRAQAIHASFLSSAPRRTARRRPLGRTWRATSAGTKYCRPGGGDGEAGPVAMAVAVKLCQSSGFGGPGTFVVVFLHMFIKLIQLFGDDDFTNPERVSAGAREEGREGRAVPGIFGGLGSFSAVAPLVMPPFTSTTYSFASRTRHKPHVGWS